MCSITGALIDDSNPPMMLPNGNVYGMGALEDMCVLFSSGRFTSRGFPRSGISSLWLPSARSGRVCACALGRGCPLKASSHLLSCGGLSFSCCFWHSDRYTRTGEIKCPRSGSVFDYGDVQKVFVM